MRLHRSAYALAVMLFAGLVAAKFDGRTGFSSLIRFGETWETRRLAALHGVPLETVPASSGYDGQFYAQLALDPLLRDPQLAASLDAPAYRARRILAPVAANVLGLGRTAWVMQAYALLNVVCWLCLGWLLFQQTRLGGWIGFARWFGCMFAVGTLESVRQSLVDLPALLLVAVASRQRSETSPSSVAWLSLANLTKETSLLATFGLLWKPPLRPGWRRTAGTLLLAALPLAAWSAYVHWRFSGAAAESSLENFSGPFFGFFQGARICLVELALGNLDGRYSFGLLAMAGLLVQLVCLWRVREPTAPWWRIGAAYSLLLPFMGLWVWSGYWAACRAVLPMTVAFNLLLPANRTFWPTWSLGNLALLHGVWRFL